MVLLSMVGEVFKNGSMVTLLPALWGKVLGELQKSRRKVWKFRKNVVTLPPN
jgi:hypothetical protein